MNEIEKVDEIAEDAAESAIRDEEKNREKNTVDREDSDEKAERKNKKKSSKKSEYSEEILSQIDDAIKKWERKYADSPNLSRILKLGQEALIKKLDKMAEAGFDLQNGHIEKGAFKRISNESINNVFAKEPELKEGIEGLFDVRPMNANTRNVNRIVNVIDNKDLKRINELKAITKHSREKYNKIKDDLENGRSFNEIIEELARKNDTTAAYETKTFLLNEMLDNKGKLSEEEKNWYNELLLKFADYDVEKIIKDPKNNDKNYAEVVSAQFVLDVIMPELNELDKKAQSEKLSPEEDFRKKFLDKFIMKNFLEKDYKPKRRKSIETIIKITEKELEKARKTTKQVEKYEEKIKEKLEVKGIEKSDNYIKDKAIDKYSEKTGISAVDIVKDKILTNFDKNAKACEEEIQNPKLLAEDKKVLGYKKEFYELIKGNIGKYDISIDKINEMREEFKYNYEDATINSMIQDVIKPILKDYKKEIENGKLSAKEHSELKNKYNIWNNIIDEEIYGLENDELEENETIINDEKEKKDYKVKRKYSIRSNAKVNTKFIDKKAKKGIMSIDQSSKVNNIVKVKIKIKDKNIARRRVINELYEDLKNMEEELENSKLSQAEIKLKKREITLYSRIIKLANGTTVDEEKINQNMKLMNISYKDAVRYEIGRSAIDPTIERYTKILETREMSPDQIERVNRSIGLLTNIRDNKILKLEESSKDDSFEQITDKAMNEQEPQTIGDIISGAMNELDDKEASAKENEQEIDKKETIEPQNDSQDNQMVVYDNSWRGRLKRGFDNIKNSATSIFNKIKGNNKETENQEVTQEINEKVSENSGLWKVDEDTQRKTEQVGREAKDNAKKVKKGVEINKGQDEAIRA